MSEPNTTCPRCQMLEKLLTPRQRRSLPMIEEIMRGESFASDIARRYESSAVYVSRLVQKLGVRLPDARRSDPYSPTILDRSDKYCACGNKISFSAEQCGRCNRADERRANPIRFLLLNGRPVSEIVWVTGRTRARVYQLAAMMGRTAEMNPPVPRSAREYKRCDGGCGKRILVQACPSGMCRKCRMRLHPAIVHFVCAECGEPDTMIRAEWASRERKGYKYPPTCAKPCMQKFRWRIGVASYRYAKHSEERVD